MKKILVVDDNLDILMVLQLFLIGQGFNVITESNGQKTRDLVTQYEPDLIILDVFLGNSDGRQICNELKHHNKTKEIPVIIFSANAKQEEVMNASHADGFLHKPFDLKDLLRIVNEHVN